MEKKKKDSDVEKLKLLWERLQKDQKDAPYGRGAEISSVKIVKDDNGRKTVQVSLSNGRKVTDIGDQRDLYQAMTPKKRINLGRLMALIEAVRTLGFEAVAMGLPPELKRALLQACKRCGIPLKVERKIQPKKLIVLSKKPESAKKAKITPKRVVAAPAVKKIRPAFSVMTSPKTLDVAVRFEQKRNKEYLALRLVRCEKEAKEEFLTLCCRAAADLGLKDEKKLTDEEKTMAAFIKRYASKTGDANGFLSENRDKILKKMSLNDLPETMRKKCSDRQTRYKRLCDARNKALELAQVELEKKYYQKDMPINLSIAALVRLSAAKMPPPKKRTSDVLTQTVSDMKAHVKNARKELKTALKERRKRIGGLISDMFASKTEKKTLQPVAQTPRRQNFAENALVRNMLKSNSYSY